MSAARPCTCICSVTLEPAAAARENVAPVGGRCVIRFALRGVSDGEERPCCEVSGGGACPGSDPRRAAAEARRRKAGCERLVPGSRRSDLQCGGSATGKFRARLEPIFGGWRAEAASGLDPLGRLVGSGPEVELSARNWTGALQGGAECRAARRGCAPFAICRVGGP